MRAARFMALNGFKLLLANNGEDLTLSGAAVEGLVDRDAIKVGANLKKLVGNFGMNFKDTGWTCIEVLKSAAGSMPEPGKTFTDDLGFRHRISRTFQTDVTWLCFCVVSKIDVQADRGPLIGVGGEEISGVGGEGITL